MKSNIVTNKIFNAYLFSKPIFLSMIRPKEAILFNSRLPFKTPILDFGCGDGFFSRVSHTDSNQQIEVGLETDPSRAKVAKKLPLYKEVTKYDGKKIPYKDSSFSTVVSNSVLEHIPEVEMSIQEIYRILKKGGVAYLSVIVSDYEKNLFGVIFLGTWYRNWMLKKAYHHQMLTQTEWQKKFEKVGFKTTEMIPYLNTGNTRLLDLFQYIAIPSIVTQYTFPTISRFFCQIQGIIFGKFIKDSVMDRDNKGLYSSCFYILQK